MTIGRDAVYHLRLGFSNFRAFQALQAIHGDLTVKMSGASRKHHERSMIVVEDVEDVEDEAAHLRFDVANIRILRVVQASHVDLVVLVDSTAVDRSRADHVAEVSSSAVDRVVHRFLIVV